AGAAAPDEPPHLSVLCRRPEQIPSVLDAGADAVYLDFEDLRDYAAGVKAVRQHADSIPVFLATPRIQKPSETGYFKLMERAEPDGILIRNLGAAQYFRHSPLRRIGDFSLNVANPYSAAILKERGRLEYLTLSYDLNAEQVADLLRAAPPEWFELTLHQHMPMFHMEHCVFCTFLSDGTSYKNCGRPCERHHVQLRDRVGQLHPLLADAGCRNTLFNGRAQTGAGFLRGFRRLGLSR
ncbi:U32 family peptidase, partial [Bacteroides ovatus]